MKSEKDSRGVRLAVLVLQMERAMWQGMCVASNCSELPWLSASKKRGTSDLQPQGTEFCYNHESSEEDSKL